LEKLIKHQACSFFSDPNERMKKKSSYGRALLLGGVIALHMAVSVVKTLLSKGQAYW
jgi:hypothetical protein